MEDNIVIKGARTHNLKNISVDPAPNFGLVERNFENVGFAHRIARSASCTLARLNKDKRKLVHGRVTK